MYKFSNSIAFGGQSERKELADDSYAIVNVSTISFEGTDTHVPLNDGVYDGGNTQQEFATAVNAVREHIQSDTPVFVHCAVGQSRSISVLATAIAAEHNRDYTEIQSELMKIRGSFTEPADSLQSKARKYLRHTQ